MKKNNIGVIAPHILLPKEGTDYSKWAVVACDQYTSQPEYWEETERIVGDSPSTLRLMLPELYLDKPDEADRIAKIRETMEKYLNDGTLRDMGEGMIVCKRTVNGHSRLGLVLALDHENYDYNKGAETLIRATEGTIVERIPPRLRIRRGAPIELPHILILIDDPEKTVIEPVFKAQEGKAPVYDFDMMQNGGHITGYFVNDENTMDSIVDNIEKLKKSVDGLAPLLFALGDGNHSFATAKANWEEIKKTLSPEEAENHPARYALVELENLHDDGIEFEPIHRILFNVSPREIIMLLKNYLEKHAEACELHFDFTKAAWERTKQTYRQYKNLHVIPFAAKGYYGSFEVLNPEAQLEVGTLQTALDEIMHDFGIEKSQLDYVHGDDVVLEKSALDGNIGFFLPAMAKDKLFTTVMKEGALPRKTFSMGEAHEKRYYLECRNIFAK